MKLKSNDLLILIQAMGELILSLINYGTKGNKLSGADYTRTGSTLWINNRAVY